jgi:hypothetical protein
VGFRLVFPGVGVMESLGYSPAWLLVEHEESRAMLAVSDEA